MSAADPEHAALAEQFLAAARSIEYRGGDFLNLFQVADQLAAVEVRDQFDGHAGLRGFGGRLFLGLAWRFVRRCAGRFFLGLNLRQRKHQERQGRAQRQADARGRCRLPEQVAERALHHGSMVGVSDVEFSAVAGRLAVDEGACSSW